MIIFVQSVYFAQILTFRPQAFLKNEFGLHIDCEYVDLSVRNCEWKKTKCDISLKSFFEKGLPPKCQYLSEINRLNILPQPYWIYSRIIFVFSAFRGETEKTHVFVVSSFSLRPEILFISPQNNANFHLFVLSLRREKTQMGVFPLLQGEKDMQTTIIVVSRRKKPIISRSQITK